ncbi:hypothetical protein ST47_g6691 [Ascochyta rabiei]|uniref:Uncharacterized protein n=1 Tax=Didymella rabiei TaxID=5454 RepID=A0A163BZB7_DIDRA|nr:hypothetical protein ST47_g6691 [Ascochyta rabiei]
MSGKRANVFGQGRPESPYEERDEPGEVPQRATAAQLAARKIKSVKPRRAAGAASSGLSQSVHFGGGQQQPSFSFGASAPVGGDSASANMFGGGNAFGGGATSSFPPAQSSGSSSAFTTNSFPAPSFGAASQTSAFHAPSGGFDFSPASSTNNPFGAIHGAAAPTNGASASFGGSLFASQAASNPFGGGQQTNTNTSSAPGSTSLFGTTNGASTTAFTFGGASSSAQAPPAAPSTPAPASQPTFSFGANNASTTAAPSTPAAAPTTSTPAPASTGIFSFGAQNNATPAATPAFGGFGAGAGADAQKSESTPAAATPQKNMFAPTPSTGLFSFGGAATPKPAEAAPPAPATNMFGGASTPAPAPAPASNLFSGLQTSTNASTPKFSFGQTQETPKAQEHTPAAPSFFNSNSLFAGLAKPASTPAPDLSSMFGAPQNKESAPKESEKPTSMFQAAPEAPKTNMFSGFSTPQPTKTTDNPQAKAGMFTAQPKASSAFSFPSSGANSTPEISSPSPATQEAPAQPSAKEAASVFNAPKAPAPQALSVPKDWVVEDFALQAMNLRYREMLSNSSLVADWSLLSIWHHQQSRSLKTKIDNAKKQRAAAKGVTGAESALSTKRKVNEDSPEAIGNKGSTPETAAPEPPKAAAPSTGFTPSFSASTGPAAPKPSSTSGFTPSFSASTDASKSAPASTGFTPSFGAPKTTASTGFTPSFGAPKAPSAGGFTPSFAERKKKAKDADYDSDDETEEEWSARYDKEEADRLAKEKEAIASAGGFSLPASTNASGATTPTPTAEPAKEATKPAPSTNLFANLAKPASASTTDGRSVFDGPSAAPSPSSNSLFGHLSSGPSSNNQDDSDDEDERGEDKSQNDQLVGSTGSTSPKRKSGGSETESDNASSKKQAMGTKGSLLSRMTRADDADSEAEKENDKPASIFGQTNGASTPTNKPFAFFNFENAGANTAPPKANTFAGDQTFKVGSPIKFGGAPATEKKKDAPTFQFQPATPSPAEFSTTPAKPPPSGSVSVPSSMFSSRADDEEGEKHEQVDLSQLTEEETAANDIVFHIDLALAKQQVDQGDGTKKWENFARGPLWILKDKILPALRSNVTGSSKKMVQATRPGKDKGLTPVYFAVKSAEVAEAFSRKYNESMPPS